VYIQCDGNHQLASAAADRDSTDCNEPQQFGNEESTKTACVTKRTGPLSCLSIRPVFQQLSESHSFSGLNTTSAGRLWKVSSVYNGL
jgi:hypothetical protein